VGNHNHKAAYCKPIVIYMLISPSDLSRISFFLWFSFSFLLVDCPFCFVSSLTRLLYRLIHVPYRHTVNGKSATLLTSGRVKIRIKANSFDFPRHLSNVLTHLRHLCRTSTQFGPEYNRQLVTLSLIHLEVS